MKRPETIDQNVALAVLEIVTRDWPHAADGIFAAYEKARALGVPIDRAESWIPLPHPVLWRGRTLWSPRSTGAWIVETRSARIEENPEERAFAASPLRSGTLSNRDSLLDKLDSELVSRVEDLAVPLDAPLRTMVDGFTDAVVLGLEYGAERRGVFLFATRREGGFDPRMLDALHTLVWALTPLSRMSRWRGVAHVVATTYVGPVTGRRVLAGELRLGEVERRNAVVWCSDLRGFTSMSVSLEPEELVRRINVMFERVAGAIHDEGGEVLKFIGDAVLGIFPYDTEEQAVDASRRALRAARLCETMPEGLAIGVGLHRGELAYGNVGAPDRLDFTVIGRTVNTASRIESLAAGLDCRVLASRALADIVPGELKLVGQHEVKGLPEPIEVYEPLR
ncbi:MAG: adenylate/guanylate cyclase domain-containing protein [Deltaproteobacteria bacterium]|nr:adenylate/guanylate cyclase domain-containing protein [Deltaproteobacteria bacterium]